MQYKESGWQGRAEGMDHDRSHDIDVLRTSIRMVGKKKAQRGELPPLLSDGNAVSPRLTFSLCFFFHYTMSDFLPI